MQAPPASTQYSPPELHLQLLGGFTVQVGDTSLPEAQWKSRRARSLVKLLALAPAHRLHRDQIIDSLWPDADLSAAANSLHQTLFAARRVLNPLAPGCLALEEGFLSLSGGEHQSLSVDVDQFEAAAVQARGSQDPQAYQSALTLYSGELLPEDRYEEWTIRRREALHQVYLQLLLGLAHLQETLRDYPTAIEALLRLLAADPSHEEAHAGLMRLYASSGQRQQALRQYQTLREVLQSELDAEPSPATRLLYEAIQSGQFEAIRPTLEQAQLPTGTVTFLFTDIEGSATLWEKQPSAMPAAVARHHALMREAIETHSGVVFKVIGDQFQAAFRFANQGVAAAVAAQQSLLAERWPEAIGAIRVRMGLHTGPAELEGADYAVSHTLNRASRVMAAGFSWQVLLSQETAGLAMRQLEAGVALKSLGEHCLKGLETIETLFQVVAPGLPQDFPRLPTAVTQPHNLPAQLTSFIGREQEIAEVRQLVSDHRLVTLTGSGGTGKTRLALHAAEGLLDIFPDGVFLIELAPLSDPELVPQVCAQTLELIEQPNTSVQAALTHYLEKKHLLLILDNCEHVIAACTRLADSLLKACLQLHILATSREILSVPGEAALRVPPLAVPDPSHLPPLESVAHYEAVRLFVERAAQVSPGIALNEGNAGAVAQICQRLDGIPLAIELAAARARMMTIEQIADRLGSNFRLLTGGGRAVLPRHQTLTAMIDWSYDQLAPQERLLLQRLSVFAGGWTLEAAEAVCADQAGENSCQEGQVASPEVIDLLAQLVDKSLIQTVSSAASACPVKPNRTCVPKAR
jgi:predicted ATPase/DNA-binding SARP family transcriptional activator